MVSQLTSIINLLQNDTGLCICCGSLKLMKFNSEIRIGFISDYFVTSDESITIINFCYNPIVFFYLVLIC